MRFDIYNHENLAHILAGKGCAPDLRCDGRGTCGRCRVTLLSGTWDVDGRTVQAPAEALSCRTRLLSEHGEVEFTPALQSGKIAADWFTAPLPATSEAVIGIDLGTTTVAAVKVFEGQIIGQAGCFNAQHRYGDNVLTRINVAATDLNGLQQAILSSVRDLLAELDLSDVKRIAVAGNTVMTCLFHGIDPSSIGVLPFTPPARIFPERHDLFGNIPVLTVPCIAGYVGGDLTAGLAETKLADGEMLVDIGTNCEIIFNTGSGLICTAAAAGPAFEGAGLHFGCRAAAGAIDHYFGSHEFSVIGNTVPQGLCGSAYIDFLAVERAAGHLNDFGRYIPKAESMNITGGIFIHEYDIEQILKAKAAVHAGIKTLEDHCGRRATKIDLAGGFARFLDLSNAIATGMLPERNYRIAGNTSLAGAARLAVQPELMYKLLELIDRPREIQLNTLPDFEDNFIDGLLLP